MPYVLVHGGTFAGSCWDLLVPHLDAPAHAVDLPGRASRPADLARVTVADFADAVVEDVERLGWDDVVLVGHSLAGITLPRVAARIPRRLARLVFVACTVPADGQTVLDTLRVDTRRLADEQADRPAPTTLAPERAVEMFCTDMDDEQTRWTLARMGPEAPGVLAEPADLSGLATGVARTWVELDGDAVVLPADQRRMAAMVGADVVTLDAGHMAMISRPAELAAILCDLRARRPSA